MSVSLRWQPPAPPAAVRPPARALRMRAAAAGWWARLADDREMVGLKLVLLAVVLALALTWEVPGWAP